MKQSRYNQNRISDAMSFSAVITPLEGWDIVGEMKVRLDVEKNSFERGTPIYENPNKQLYTVTGNTQGYQYPGMHWKNSTWGSYTRGDAFNYYLSPNVSSSYTHQWGEHFFKAMAGCPVTVRLLDPPLHEFVPHDLKGQEEMAEAMGVSVKEIQKRVESLCEHNPMFCLLYTSDAADE